MSTLLHLLIESTAWVLVGTTVTVTAGVAVTHLWNRHQGVHGRAVARAR